MTQGDDLYSIGEYLIDNPVGIVHDFAHRRIRPLWDGATLLGEFLQQLDPIEQAGEPVSRGEWILGPEVVHRRERTLERERRPSEVQRVSLSRSA